MHTDRKKPEVTTAIILEKRITNKDKNKHPVKLRITYQRRRKYYTIKTKYLSINEFETIYYQKSRGKNKELRKKFEKIENRAIDIIDNVLNEFSFEAFEKEYLTHKKQETSIKAYFEEKASELDEVNKIQTAALYRATLKSLLEYDKNITFLKISPKYLRNYEKWMIDEGNSYATIGIYLRNLKHIINRAIKNRVVNEYPFGTDKDKYQIPKGKNTKKALTMADIEKLFLYKTENRNEYLALQYFLFSYLCNGMNMVDIANLRYSNIQDNSLKFIRQKTKDTTNTKVEINVYLLPEAFEIINNIGNENTKPDNYVFPVFSDGLSEIDKYKILKQHIKNTNKYLRQIANKIGIDGKITTYYARHSYSTILKRLGTPIEFISEQLGHQSTNVTRSYLDSFEDEQRVMHSSKLVDFEKKL